ncbi:MAG: hypothetical protein V2I26_17045 [Halieaceae bacterium]|jgi:hypothetical protein|nr:hypothetical protein [Halieaceae bacterium]
MATNSIGHIPLKSQLWLTGFLVLNISAFTLVTFLGMGSASLVLSWAKTHSDSLLILLLAMVVTLISGNLVRSNLKAILVFWNWSEPWPIKRAFTRYLPKEARQGPGAADTGTGQPPIDLEAQKNLWFQIYRKYSSEPAVTEAGTHFRLAQELTWLSFVILLFFGLGSMVIGDITPQTLAYTACLLIQYISASMLARTIGLRFFSDVLAVAQTHKIIAKGLSDPG